MPSQLKFPGGKFWQADFPENCDFAVAKFAAGKYSTVSFCGISTDKFTETPVDRCEFRMHKSSLYDDDYSIRIISSIRKANVVSCRTINIFSSFIEIVNDFSFREHLSIRELNIDPLLLSSNWELKTALVLDEKSKQPICLDSPGKIKSRKPVLAAIFQSQDGVIAEIGTGDDLWRWLLAQKIPEASSSFSIYRKNELWQIDRKLLIFKEEFPIPKKDFRLSWFIKFSHRDDLRNSQLRLRKNSPEFSLANQNCPPNAKISWKNQKSECACLRSNWARRELRSFIRKLANKNPSLITIRNFDCSICDISSHLGRNDENPRPHWNIIEAAKFKRWAEKILSKSKSKVFFVPDEKSALTKLSALD